MHRSSLAFRSVPPAAAHPNPPQERGGSVAPSHGGIMGGVTINHRCPVWMLSRPSKPVASLKSLVVLAVIAAATSSSGGDDTPAPPRKLDFTREIRPILANHCWSCHGPDEKQRKAGLRLDVEDASRAKLESGFAAIVPGKSGESELVARIESADDAEI